MGVMVGLAWGVAALPHPLAAQQNASVLVRANVIRVAVASHTLDSLGRAVLVSRSPAARADATARALTQGVRLWVERAGAGRAAARGAAEPGSGTLRRRDVLHVEYVAN